MGTVGKGVFIAVLSVALAACAPDSERVAAPTDGEDWSGFGILENILRWTPEQQLRGYRNIDKIYPTRARAASENPFPLPKRERDLSAVRYEVEGASFDLDGFLEHNHVVGLLIIEDGDIALERYTAGNTPQTRWYSFSVAKSVVSLLALST